MIPEFPFSVIKTLQPMVKMIPKICPEDIKTPVLIDSPTGCVSSTPKSMPTGSTLIVAKPRTKHARVTSQTIIVGKEKSNAIGKTAVSQLIMISAVL